MSQFVVFERIFSGVENYEMYMRYAGYILALIAR
jgi:hypothetical protein